LNNNFFFNKEVRLLGFATFIDLHLQLYSKPGSMAVRV